MRTIDLEYGKYLFKKQPMLRRLISAGVIAVFFSTTHMSVYALSSLSAEKDAWVGKQHHEVSLTNLAQVQVPSEIGTVLEIFQSASNHSLLNGMPASEVVILIQDAHAIPAAQRHIQRLIEHFQKNYGVKLVAFEGASSGVDPQIFKSFPNKEMLHQVFERYYINGELTGITAAAIFNKEPGIYRGVEDRRLYEQGLGLYLKAMAKAPIIIKELEEQKKRNQRAKNKIYSNELLAIDGMLEDFHKNKRDLFSALQLLKSATEKEQSQKLNSAPLLPEDLALLLEEDGRDDSEKISIQFKVKKIAEKMRLYLIAGEENYTGVKAKTLNSGICEQMPCDLAHFNQKYQAFLISELEPEAFALYLKEFADQLVIAEGRKVDREKLDSLKELNAIRNALFSDRSLNQLMSNQKRMRDIQGSKLYHDFEHYAQGVKASLFRSDKEKRLDSDSRELELLEKLANLEIDWEDWNELKPNLPEAIAAMRKMKADLSFHAAFYRNAERREKAFYENLLVLMKDKRIMNYDSPGAIFIAGGFHTNGLTRKLQEAGIAYVLVAPQINSIPEHTHYREHMRGEVSWKNNFKVVGGKVNLYDAFVRGTRDRLLEEGVKGMMNDKSSNDASAGAFPGDGHSRRTAGLLKAWRDQIIRDLAKKKEIGRSREYTRFLDEVISKAQYLQSRSVMEDDLDARWNARVERFIQGLRMLVMRKQLTNQSILQLLRTSTIIEAVLAGSLVPKFGIRKAFIPSIVSRPSIRAEIRNSPRANDETLKQILTEHLMKSIPVSGISMPILETFVLRLMNVNAWQVWEVFRQISQEAETHDFIGQYQKQGFANIETAKAVKRKIKLLMSQLETDGKKIKNKNAYEQSVFTLLEDFIVTFSTASAIGSDSSAGIVQETIRSFYQGIDDYTAGKRSWSYQVNGISIGSWLRNYEMTLTRLDPQMVRIEAVVQTGKVFRMILDPNSGRLIALLFSLENSILKYPTGRKRGKILSADSILSIFRFFHVVELGRVFVESVILFAVARYHWGFGTILGSIVVAFAFISQAINLTVSSLWRMYLRRSAFGRKKKIMELLKRFIIENESDHIHKITPDDRISIDFKYRFRQAQHNNKSINNSEDNISLESLAIEKTIKELTPFEVLALQTFIYDERRPLPSVQMSASHEFRGTLTQLEMETFMRKIYEIQQGLGGFYRDAIWNAAYERFYMNNFATSRPSSAASGQDISFWSDVFKGLLDKVMSTRSVKDPFKPAGVRTMERKSYVELLPGGEIRFDFETSQFPQDGISIFLGDSNGLEEILLKHVSAGWFSSEKYQLEIPTKKIEYPFPRSQTEYLGRETKPFLEKSYVVADRHVMMRMEEIPSGKIRVIVKDGWENGPSGRKTLVQYLFNAKAVDSPVRSELRHPVQENDKAQKVNIGEILTREKKLAEEASEIEKKVPALGITARVLARQILSADINMDISLKDLQETVDFIGAYLKDGTLEYRLALLRTSLDHAFDEIEMALMEDEVGYYYRLLDIVSFYQKKVSQKIADRGVYVGIHYSNVNREIFEELIPDVLRDVSVRGLVHRLILSRENQTSIPRLFRNRLNALFERNHETMISNDPEETAEILAGDQDRFGMVVFRPDSEWYSKIRRISVIGFKGERLKKLNRIERRAFVLMQLFLAIVVGFEGTSGIDALIKQYPDYFEGVVVRGGRDITISIDTFLEKIRASRHSIQTAV